MGPGPIHDPPIFSWKLVKTEPSRSQHHQIRLLRTPTYNIKTQNGAIAAIFEF